MSTARSKNARDCGITKKQRQFFGNDDFDTDCLFIESKFTHGRELLTLLQRRCNYCLCEGADTGSQLQR